MGFETVFASLCVFKLLFNVLSCCKDVKIIISAYVFMKFWNGWKNRIILSNALHLLDFESGFALTLGPNYNVLMGCEHYFYIVPLTGWSIIIFSYESSLTICFSIACMHLFLSLIFFFFGSMYMFEQ